MLGHSRIYMTQQNYASYLPYKNRKKVKVPAVEVQSEDLKKASEQLGNLIKL